MTFSTRDIRRGMDVYSADNVYQGTVVWIVERPARREPPEPRAGHDSAARHAGTFSGEALGPMPTAALGNSGPSAQTPATRYASVARGPRVGEGHTASDREPAELIVVRLLTALDWTTLRPKIQRIPVSRVQSVSLERIVLAQATVGR